MKNKNGSLLIGVLVAVSVVTMFAVSLGIFIRSKIELSKANSYTRLTREGCMNAAVLCLAEKTGASSDHEFYASIDEAWERRADEWIMRVSSERWDDTLKKQSALSDECGKIPLSLKIPAIYASLLKNTCSLPDSSATILGERIAAQDFVSLDQLHSVTGVTDEIYIRVSPFLTPVHTDKININSASETVIKSLFGVAGEFASGPSENLFSKIKAFRNAGGTFTSEAPAYIAKDLGGLPPDEMLILNYCEQYLTVKASYLSGYAEATPAFAWHTDKRPGLAYFIWDVENRRFVLWSEL